MRITFLGTGTSTGVPVIGCTCEVCRSTDPRDRRTRTSALVDWDDMRILIDTSPELRLQAVKNDVTNVDAVLYTHAHADHIAGFDDLRRFNYLRQAPLDVYADARTSALIKERFAYAFENPFPFFGGKPDLNLHVFEGPFSVEGRCVQPFQVQHGGWTVTGFRFDRLVYLTDAKLIPEETMDAMRGAEVLVINALRETPHPVHLSLEEAQDVIREIGPRKAYIVHVSHELGRHEVVNASLDDGVELAFDGLQVEVG